MSDRRSFLRGLTALPFIGGSVAVHGEPVLVQHPLVTETLLDRYLEFLEIERVQAIVESREFHFARVHPDILAEYGNGFIREHVERNFCLPEIPARFDLLRAMRPSTRVATLMTAAGPGEPIREILRWNPQ